MFAIDHYRNGVTSRYLWMKREMVSIFLSSVSFFDKFLSSLTVADFNTDIFTASDCIVETPIPTVELRIFKKKFQRLQDGYIFTVWGIRTEKIFFAKKNNPLLQSKLEIRRDCYFYFSRSMADMLFRRKALEKNFNFSLTDALKLVGSLKQVYLFIFLLFF